MFFKNVEYFTHTLSKISPKMHVLESGIIFYNYLLEFFVYSFIVEYCFMEGLNTQKLLTSHLILKSSINYENLFLKYFNLSILRQKFVA